MVDIPTPFPKIGGESDGDEGELMEMVQSMVGMGEGKKDDVRGDQSFNFENSEKKHHGMVPPSDDSGSFKNSKKSIKKTEN